MKDIDTLKIVGKTPKNSFEAIDLLNIKTSQLTDAIHIIKSAIDNPELQEQNTKRMNEFLSKFYKNETTTAR